MNNPNTPKKGKKLTQQEVVTIHAFLAEHIVKNNDDTVSYKGLWTDAARNAFWKSAAVEKLRKAGIMVWGVSDLDDLRRSESEIIKRARDNALVTFAVVKDGRWYERGKMGWFGHASDEKDTDVWSQEFAAMLDGLPPTTWVTIVDCHI